MGRVKAGGAECQTLKATRRRRRRGLECGYTSRILHLALLWLRRPRSCRPTRNSSSERQYYYAFEPSKHWCFSIYLLMISERQLAANRANLKKGIENRIAKRVTKPCEGCGKTLQLSVSVAATKRFCSWACRKVAMVGEGAPNYGKGDKLRGSLNPNYKSGVPGNRTTGDIGRRFRRSVLRRDGYQCVVCGAGAPLHAHHIDNYASFPLLHGDPSNGLTLCVPCHKKAHSKDGGYAFVTTEGKLINKFRTGSDLPHQGSSRMTAIGTFLLGWAENDSTKAEVLSVVRSFRREEKSTAGASQQSATAAAFVVLAVRTGIGIWNGTELKLK